MDRVTGEITGYNCAKCGERHAMFPTAETIPLAVIERIQARLEHEHEVRQKLPLESYVGITVALQIIQEEVERG